ncbi:MAG: efflux RND transporter permease subunit [Betaproteobacteria bacterium]|nr:efflux RND transporter permease subunit [Betaproteobacteria bacterium]
MWIVRLALSRPYTFVVVAMLIVLLGIVSIFRMPKDIFPEIAEPIVTLIWQYVGIPADAFEKQITIFSEQQINTTVSNIKRIESHTINGKNVIRIYFQPSVRIDQAVSQITATSQTIIRRMPPGQQPPQIVQYDASSVPILQIALGSDTMSEQQLYDQGLWLVRNEVVPVSGATVPLPYGGRPRLVMIDADPLRMHAKGVTVKDINDALNRQNVNLPTGSTQIGSRDYVLSINNSPEKIAELGDLPIRTIGGAMVYIRDVADVRDGYNEQTSLVRHDGRKSALITVLKSGGASTLDIIRDVRQRLSNVTLPEGLSLSFLFDQSVFVVNAMHAVVVEGLMAAVLTGLLILLFLGSWRSMVVVVTSIPLAILFSIIMLSAMGYSLNLMTLGGLALAVGILVDDATVTIENIHRHIAMGKGLKQSILDGSQQIVVPVLVSMLCICIVFLPVLLLTGAARYLFTPMALAVVFSILASYGLSRTLVPVMSRYLLLEDEHGDGHGVMARLHSVVETSFERLRRNYLSALRWALASRVTVFALFIVLVIGSAGAVLFIGWEFFPVVDAGQIRLHVNAPAGTRIDDTGVIFSKVQDEIRRTIDAKDLDVIIDNVGIPPSTNLAYSDNVTLSSGDGEILVSLKPDHQVATKEYVRRLRQRLPEQFPECTFYFQPGDMMNQILNFGLPAPIDVKIIGGDYKNFHLAKEIEARMKRIAGAVDVHVHQIMNQPALRVQVDRTRAAQLGFSQREIAENFLIASSSSVVVTPNYWNDPKTGRPYQVVVVQPHETALNSVEAVLNIPLPGKGQSPTQTLGNVATVKHVELPAIINHVNTELAFDVYANVQGRDLGAVASDVRKVVDEFIPKALEQKNNTRIEIAGQAESMYDAFTRMGIGLIAAVLLVYFIMVINFQSWTDPFIIITALPGAFCGIIWMLFLSGTSFSVPSLMGAIMSVGVATANSILMVSFANEQLRNGMSPIEAALEAGSTRLRPVLMTAAAMVIGMAPMASGLGEGGEQNAPLGRAVIGGLLLATVATLFFVPVVFSLLRRHGVPKPRFADDGVVLATDTARH